MDRIAQMQEQLAQTLKEIEKMGNKTAEERMAPYIQEEDRARVRRELEQQFPPLDIRLPGCPLHSCL